MSVLVLGIGNILMNDDGVGIRVVQQLTEEYRFPPEVTLLDGGTLGLDLLPHLEGVERLLVVDAVETGGEPGSLIRLTGDEIPLALATKVSPHQMGLKDLLTVADLQGYAPPVMVLWGVQPASIEMNLELSSAVAAQVAALKANVLTELAAWGITPQKV
jgi:hydrogenase maturation protease